MAILPRAAAIFVDSELGKKNTARRYGVDQERIHILPFQAAEATQREVDSNASPLEKYQLELPYVFYPAQFWAHKNHVYLLEGLHLLENQYGKRVGAIFSGGDMGCRAYIECFAKKLSLKDRIRFVGFVSDEEIVALYRHSLALVMPSYFGPTNLPPLEAFQLGVPVLYSDKDGLREQVGDAALLMNLNNPESMAIHLKNLIDDEHLARRLIIAGYKRLKFYNSYDRLGLLQNVIEDFSWRRLCWE
jgi:glycosyltransferase involved in cell wall biosynthesis